MTARDSVDKPGPSLTSLPDRPCPFRRPATLGLSGNSPPPEGWPQAGVVPLGRQVAFGFTIHDSHSHPPTSVGRWSAGRRQVVFGFTIHDSHSHPPTSVGRWSAGGRQVAFGFTIHDSHSHPPQASAVGRAGGRQVSSRRFSHSKSSFTSGIIRVSSPRARGSSTWSRHLGALVRRAARSRGRYDGWTGGRAGEQRRPPSGLRPPSPSGEGPIM